MTATISLADAPAKPGQYWQWQGHEIYYVHAGEPRSDRPPLLLVHGFGASTDHWRKNVADLAADFDVWAIDLLGFGRSEKADRVYSGELWREQLHDFITEVIGEPAVLAGNSLGGYASLCVAAGEPQSVRGLVLLNSAGPFSDDPRVQKPNPVKAFIGKVFRSVLLQPLPSYLIFQNARRKSTIRKTLQRVYVDQSAVTDQLVEDIYRPSCDRGASRVFASVFKSPRGDTLDVLLEQMECPLLTIWGQGDPWMNTGDRSAKFRQYYPTLTEHFLGAGHCPHDESPKEVDQIIRQWMDDTVTKG
ncbi:MAG: alpha/beta fold hydrolase [Cyanophyceae cyanobacterium]